jgi:hypothetical protein
VSLSSSSLPNEGFVQITTDNGTKSVCSETLKNKANDTVCRQLGYIREDPLVKKAAPSGTEEETFSGSIDCNGGDTKLSQCAFFKSDNGCSELSYIKCKYIYIQVDDGKLGWELLELEQMRKEQKRQKI